MKRYTYWCLDGCGKKVEYNGTYGRNDDFHKPYVCGSCGLGHSKEEIKTGKKDGNEQS